MTNSWPPEGYVLAKISDIETEEALEQGAILCHDCGEPIYEGEDYYEIGCHIYCEKCIEAFRMTNWGREII